MTCLNQDLQSKLDSLKVIISKYGKLSVAYSGGVDSSLLLKISNDVLGHDVTAYFADSIVQTVEEKEAAVKFAAEISAELVVLDFDLLAFPDFVKNPVERCFFCKEKIFSEIVNCSTKSGVKIIADGTNVDDLSDFRPGAKAIQLLGIKSPLVEAGLVKKEIRQISKCLGLSSWNRHSASCLATRVEPGTVITRERLELIDSAERFLKNEGFLGCRVKINEDSCVIELTEGDSTRFFEKNIQADFVNFMDHQGIHRVLLNLKEREGVSI